MQSEGRAQAGAGGAVGDPMTGVLLDGRYLVGPRIARGGMASVYEATDTRLDRPCAVKIMHPGLGDDDSFAERFVREARSAAKLNHPHVVGVFDQGDHDGTVFLVMEHVPGHTLRDVIRTEAPMAPARAIALIEPVLSALAAAHRARLVHRDIKPENVLIADDGRIKVADFGLAKAISTDTQHTATGGVLIGTVSYLAPELVVDGRSDARADVYAAGVVLYELLTGTKPHEGESPIAVAYKHVHEDVPPPSRLMPGIPPYVDALVARATARDLDQRPADAGVLLHQVHRVAHALAHGVRDDEELTADLALLSPTSTQPIAVLRDGREDTASDLFDEEEFERLMAPDAIIDTDDTDVIQQLPVHDSSHRPSPTPARAPTPALIPAPDPTRARTTVPAPPPRSPGRVPAITTARRPPRWRGPALLLLALLLVAGAGAGVWWFGDGRYTVPPSVVGLTLDNATARLEAAGFDVKVGDHSYSETVKRDVVMATDPQPGSRALRNGTVTLTVSLGKERYKVPVTKGRTEDRAQDALLAAHLTFGQAVDRWSETVGKGLVIRSTPPPGVKVKPATVVDLVVSKGPRPIRPRDWTGQDADRAQKALERQGLTVTRADGVYSDTVPEGHVVSQDPASGVLHRGDTVTLTVSRGPELVQIPGDLVAMGVDAATKELEDLGFKVEVTHAQYYIGVGYVYSSDPGPGAMAPKGSTVTLDII